MRDRLGPLSTRQRVEICVRFRTNTPLKRALRTLARRYRALTTEIRELTGEVVEIVEVIAPTLPTLTGVCHDVAAKLLITAGEYPHRIRNEADFAALCGVSPIDASSGSNGVTGSTEGGDRSADNALWTIALVRMSYDEGTQTYVKRRTAEGMTKREIIRCLKRYIARQVHHATP